MELIHVVGRPPASVEPLALAIGKFDGVHVGHQKIIHETRRLAGGGRVAVMSLWPHPAWVLAHKPGYEQALTPESEQVRLLEPLGVDVLYRVRFTPEYAQTTAEAFVREHLRPLQVTHVVVGEDFTFGRGGRAGVSELSRLCAEMGASVTVVEPVEIGGVKVSSSQVRRHLANGEVSAVAPLLGRPYAVSGTVVHGQALGRQIGFPTANLGGMDEFVLPAPGVYAVQVEVPNEHGVSVYGGVLNAGVRPTVDGRRFQMEVHLLDYAGDLYGRSVRVQFVERVRDEQKFDGIPALTAQIARDVATARQILAPSVSTRAATDVR